jgi:hypothetical protein
MFDKPRYYINRWTWIACILTGLAIWETTRLFFLGFLAAHLSFFGYLIFFGKWYFRYVEPINPSDTDDAPGSANQESSHGQV